MPTKYVTDKRGAELAREILDTIEVEEKLLKKFAKALPYIPDDKDEIIDEAVDETNVWEQGVWGQVYLDELPSGVDIAPVPDRAFSSDNDWRQDSLVSVSGGLTCGTAMCFAGHATNMVGDRLVISVDSDIAYELRKGKTKRRSLRSFIKGLGYKHYPTRIEVDQVLTRGGKMMGIRERARDLLGLDEVEADMLFAGSNDLKELRRLVKRMEKGKHLVTGKPKD